MHIRGNKRLYDHYYRQFTLYGSLYRLLNKTEQEDNYNIAEFVSVNNNYIKILCKEINPDSYDIVITLTKEGEQKFNTF
jgi:hypothetical protein